MKSFEGEPSLQKLVGMIDNVKHSSLLWHGIIAALKGFIMHFLLEGHNNKKEKQELRHGIFRSTRP